VQQNADGQERGVEFSLLQGKSRENYFSIFEKPMKQGLFAYLGGSSGKRRRISRETRRTSEQRAWSDHPLADSTFCALTPL
jgi:Uri superfamily endonuclease